MSKQTLLRMCIPALCCTSKGTWKRRWLRPCRREPGNGGWFSLVEGNLETSPLVEGNLEAPAPSKGTWKLRPQTGNSGPVEGNLETPPPSKGTWNRRLLSSVNVHPSRVQMNKKQTTAEPREGIASWRLTGSSTARRLNRPAEFLICFR